MRVSHEFIKRSEEGDRKITLGGTTNNHTFSPYGPGGGPWGHVPPGNPFAGREQGPAYREQIHGSSVYGSGYTDRLYNTRGVEKHGFPFFFWPITWGGSGVGTGAYLHTREYGDPENSTRPGGPMHYSTYVSQDSSKNSTFHIVADNSTIIELMVDIEADCGSLIDNFSSSDPNARRPTAMSNSSSSDPQPESTVQYYRASSISLTLDGYNNSDAFSEEDNEQADPLPSNYDGSLFEYDDWRGGVVGRWECCSVLAAWMVDVGCGG